MSRHGVVLGLATVVLLLGNTRADEPKKTEGAGKPPWQRLLQGDEAKLAEQLQQKIDKHLEAAEFEAALKATEELLTLGQKGQGADHWNAVDADWQRKKFQIILTREVAEQKAMVKVPALVREAEVAKAMGRFREEQTLRERLLETYRKLLGEEYPDTAASYNELAVNK
jgi:hypothetical protein